MQTHTPRILMVLTSADRLQGLSKSTGSWLEEVAAPYYTFLDAKCSVTLASPKGGAAPIDAESLQEQNQTASTRRFEADAAATHALANTAALSALDFAQYDAVFFAGGHGTMEDFPVDAQVRKLVEHFYTRHKPVAAVCHGPACLVSAVKGNGEPLIRGHRFTCFTDAEEIAVGLETQVPFMLEARLSAQGGTADVAAPFAPKVVADGALITGQNPASAIPTAEAVIAYVRRHGAQPAAA